jgi:hypothetical protein
MMRCLKPARRILFGNVIARGMRPLTVRALKQFSCYRVKSSYDILTIRDNFFSARCEARRDLRRD